MNQDRPKKSSVFTDITEKYNFSLPQQVPRIDGHSEMVTDMAFSPFDDGLLATGSQVGNLINVAPTILEESLLASQSTLLNIKYTVYNILKNLHFLIV